LRPDHKKIAQGRLEADNYAFLIPASRIAATVLNEILITLSGTDYEKGLLMHFERAATKQQRSRPRR
jgi:hypothetical protein